ncbi:TetR family transcriptional regulator, partial [Ruegeria sp. NA]|nr:TetR family transcriptional regulator [Ruegeria sp. NA]
RSIAKRAGISLGTLTYHFSGKAQLIAMCLDLFVDSEINSLTKLANFSDEPEIALEAAIRNQVELTLHPYARRFDFEYWAYAEHD